jgi:acyl-CoA synthetase (NDP forming)
MSDSIGPGHVRRLFNPRSVALIGATDKSRWSWSIFGNLKLHGFGGPVYLVNPRGVPVHGQDSYTSIADLPSPVDLAFVMVPTAAVLDVLTEVADHGIPSVVLLTSGFAEVGEEGAELERQVVDLARRRGLTILGPNGNGFINAAARITPYGLPIDDPLLRGPVGVVLQSGALASSVLTFAQARNVGVSLLVSMGNESMVSMTDVMRYLIDDDATRVIALFIESVRRPDEFIALAREALAEGKPIVAIKVGRSQTGARVAKAHTGSLVGDDAVVDAVFRQHGVIRVDSLEDLIITAGLLAASGPLPGGRFGFVTASGGASEIIADRAEDEGIEIPEFSAQTVERLRRVVPAFAATQNPVDVTGYVLVDRDLLRNALTAVHDDPSLDALVLVADLPRAVSPDPALVIENYRLSSEVIRRCAKPIVVMGNTLTDITPFGREVASQTGYPGILGGIHHGLTALGRAVRWSELHRAAASRAAVVQSRAEPGLAVPDEPGATWPEYRASPFLSEHGIPVVPSVLVTDPQSAVDAAGALGYPVVVKLAADGIEHKSDIGGVKVGLRSPADVLAAYADVTDAGKQAGADVRGALVQPQRAGGIELLVGIVTDPAWGQVLAVGLGGVWVEILRDTAVRVLPVDRDQIRQALRSLRGAQLFDGHRGTEKADLDAVADAIAAMAALAGRLGDRLEALEINPLLVRGSQVEALDTLISWRHIKSKSLYRTVPCFAWQASDLRTVGQRSDCIDSSNSVLEGRPWNQHCGSRATRRQAPGSGRAPRARSARCSTPPARSSSSRASPRRASPRWSGGRTQAWAAFTTTSAARASCSSRSGKSTRRRTRTRRARPSRRPSGPA